MKVKVTSKVKILHPDHGYMYPGIVYEVSSLSGIRDYVEVIGEYQTKVVIERPILADGTPLSALPAAQVSQEQTVKPLKRGRKKKAEA